MTESSHAQPSPDRPATSETGGTLPLRTRFLQALAHLYAGHRDLCDVHLGTEQTHLRTNIFSSDHAHRIQLHHRSHSSSTEIQEFAAWADAIGARDATALTGGQFSVYVLGAIHGHPVEVWTVIDELRHVTFRGPVTIPVRVLVEAEAKTKLVLPDALAAAGFPGYPAAEVQP